MFDFLLTTFYLLKIYIHFHFPFSMFIRFNNIFSFHFLLFLSILKPDRIKSEGYPSEVHQVQTDDGYKLQLHRIPYGIKSSKTDKPRPPVFLMHGFCESSNGWIVLGPDNSLAYLLGEQHFCNTNEPF